MSILDFNSMCVLRVRLWASSIRNISGALTSDSQTTEVNPCGFHTYIIIFRIALKSYQLIYLRQKYINGFLTNVITQ